MGDEEMCSSGPFKEILGRPIVGPRAQQLSELSKALPLSPKAKEKTTVEQVDLGYFN